MYLLWGHWLRTQLWTLNQILILVLCYWTRHMKQSYSSNDQIGMTIPIQGPYYRPKTALSWFQCNITVNLEIIPFIGSGTPWGKTLPTQNPEVKTEDCVSFFKCTNTFSKLHRSQWIKGTLWLKASWCVRKHSLLRSLWKARWARWTG